MSDFLPVKVMISIKQLMAARNDIVTWVNKNSTTILDQFNKNKGTGHRKGKIFGIPLFVGLSGYCDGEVKITVQIANVVPKWDVKVAVDKLDMLIGNGLVELSDVVDQVLFRLCITILGKIMFTETECIYARYEQLLVAKDYVTLKQEFPSIRMMVSDGSVAYSSIGPGGTLLRECSVNDNRNMFVFGSLGKDLGNNMVFRELTTREETVLYLCDNPSPISDKDNDAVMQLVEWGVNDITLQVIMGMYDPALTDTLAHVYNI